MSQVFLEIILKAGETADFGIESRDEIEEPLEKALSETGLGEVTGGGGGSGVYIVDVEVPDEEQFGEALRVIRRVLQDLKVPPSTLIKRHEPDETAFSVYS
ncbi:MAG: hypothetical protein U1D97_01140 [Desulfuromonadales bacterium]|nr:hypothetical protein [Desulfuromonadales bacterium]